MDQCTTRSICSSRITNHVFHNSKLSAPAAFTTLKLGSFAYAGLEAEAELAARKRSYEIGYLGEAVVDDRGSSFAFQASSNTDIFLADCVLKDISLRGN